MKKPDSTGNTKSDQPRGQAGETIYTFEALHKCLKGVPLAKSGRMQEALQAFDGAIENDPTLAASWYNKGFVLCAEERYREALESFDKAIEISPNFPHPWNGKGFVLCTLKRYEEALEAFKQALEINPSMAYAWTGIGNANIGMERYQEALETLNRAIQMDPEFALPWNSKAILLEIRPEMETIAGHSAEQSLCRAAYLRGKFQQRFPLHAAMLLAPASHLDLPLMTRRLVLEMNQSDMDPEYRGFLDRTGKKCENALALLSSINSTTTLNGTDKEFWKGIVNYYNGDPVQALKHFDSVDSSDETNLAGQYYLLQSLKAVLEPAEKEKSFTMKQASTALNISGVNMTVNQLYYAGQIFYLASEIKMAASCFERNTFHRPSQYMLHMCLRTQNSESADPLFRTIVTAEQATGGFLGMTDIPEIDPASTGWIKDLELAVNFREIEQSVILVRGLIG